MKVCIKFKEMCLFLYNLKSSFMFYKVLKDISAVYLFCVFVVFMSIMNDCSVGVEEVQTHSQMKKQQHKVSLFVVVAL